MTTEIDALMQLGYNHSAVSNGYFTCRARDTIGACIAKMSGQWFVQFFPWPEPKIDADFKAIIGHEAYAEFITSKASQTAAADGKLFDKWPFLLCDVNVDILTIKCVIEDGLATIEGIEHASDQTR